MDVSNLSNLWTAWPVSGPSRISTLLGGTNNLVWRADATDGQSYVLRLSPDLTHISRIRYESALLQALSDKDLPFRLPLPLRANSGDIIVRFEQEQGTAALATLSPLLPGKLQDRSPERNDLLIASHAGSTLALLDNALASLSEIQSP